MFVRLTLSLCALSPEEDVALEIAVSQAVAAVADRCMSVESINLSACALVRGAEFAVAVAGIWCSSGGAGRTLTADVMGSTHVLLLGSTSTAHLATAAI